MSGNTMVRMANEIAANFGALDEAKATAETAGHIRRFWEPRMRAELKRLTAEGQTSGLEPVARKAVDDI